MNTHETYLMREDGKGDEVEIQVVVEYTYHAGCRGMRDSLGGKRGAGPPLEPDEPACVEIERAFVLGKDGKRGEELELDLSEIDCIETEICEAMI